MNILFNLNIIIKLYDKITIRQGVFFGNLYEILKVNLVGKQNGEPFTD